MQPLGAKSTDLNEEMQATNRERRQRVRHRVHTPAYASLNGDSRGTELDLSEILDISEEGMAIQTVSPLEINSSLKLSLDLSETRAYIRATGQVIWSDDSGRVGIRFSRIEPPLGELREWLFQNALSACANHAAAAPGDLWQQEESQGESSFEPCVADKHPEDRIPEVLPPAPPDYTTILTALAVVTREVEAAGSDLEAALNVVAERARTFTRSTGAAVALSQGAEMICVATAGPDAPGLGSRLQVGSGFSGECVRAGRLLRCEDSETDSRVDRESCRGLGIRSMIAVPIRLGDSVVGLLEAFSPQPNTFNSTDEVVLQRLAETALAAINRAARSSIEKARSLENLALQLKDQAAEPPEASAVQSASVVSDPMSYSRKILLGAAAVLLIVLVWLIAPWTKSVSSSNQSHPRSSTRTPAGLAKTPAATAADAGSIEGLQQLAQQGDAAAQYALGVHYATGDGVKQDYSEAVGWFSKAAEQGQVMAQATLGTYYWAGRGVPKDISKAYFWTILAQAGGDKSSKAYVSILTTGMTRAQILAAQQAAEEWLKQHRVTGKSSPEVQ